MGFKGRHRSEGQGLGLIGSSCFLQTRPTREWAVGGQGIKWDGSEGRLIPEINRRQSRRSARRSERALLCYVLYRIFSRVSTRQDYVPWASRLWWLRCRVLILAECWLQILGWMLMLLHEQVFADCV